MNCSEVRSLVHAHLDGELDLMRQMEVDDHLRQCEACEAIHASQRAIRSALTADDLYFTAPISLQRKVRAAIRSTAEPSRWWARTFSPRRLALAGAAAVVIVAAIAGPILSRREHNDQIAQEVVSAHIRSLMASHLTDVLSSDQHTVKPWFAGKLDFSPPVVDLKDRGFPLVGGRLDYVENRPIAALAYRSGQHVINLFVWPSTSSIDVGESFVGRQGYNALSWTRDRTNFWAVSDLNATELRRFAQLVEDHPAGE
jgi:anti-sigma factor RsiW